jgi:integrase
VPLDVVRHSDVQAWLADLLAAGLSPASVRKCSGVLSSILALAIKDRRILSNPAEGLSLPRVVGRRRQYLTPEQVADLASRAADPPHHRMRETYRQYRLAVFVLAYCGLRWSELAALHVDSIDVKRRRLEVAQAVTELNGGRLVWGTPKSHERRWVPIPRFLAEELAKHIDGRKRDELVFTTPTGQPLRNRSARRAWFDHAVAGLGIPTLTPHDLRHTAASLAVSAGANVKAVQRMLGHASAAMTLDTYADLFDDDLEAVGERLDAIARKAGVYKMCTEPEMIKLPRRPPRYANPVNTGPVVGGRYWDRTSDPCRVNSPPQL